MNFLNRVENNDFTDDEKVASVRMVRGEDFVCAAWDEYYTACCKKAGIDPDNTGWNPIG